MQRREHRSPASRRQGECRSDSGDSFEMDDRVASRGRLKSRVALLPSRKPGVTRCARFAAARRPVSCHHPVLEVGDAGRLDGPDLLELHLRVPEVVEEASTVAEQYWNDVELKLVQ